MARSTGAKKPPRPKSTASTRTFAALDRLTFYSAEDAQLEPPTSRHERSPLDIPKPGALRRRAAPTVIVPPGGGVTQQSPSPPSSDEPYSPPADMDFERGAVHAADDDDDWMDRQLEREHSQLDKFVAMSRAQQPQQAPPVSVQTQPLPLPQPQRSALAKHRSSLTKRNTDDQLHPARSVRVAGDVENMEPVARRRGSPQRRGTAVSAPAKGHRDSVTGDWMTSPLQPPQPPPAVFDTPSQQQQQQQQHLTAKSSHSRRVSIAEKVIVAEAEPTDSAADASALLRRSSGVKSLKAASAAVTAAVVATRFRSAPPVDSKPAKPQPPYEIWKSFEQGILPFLVVLSM